jgi:trans-2,3-dihydro-3-hydroxyanthranilate isomerase
MRFHFYTADVFTDRLFGGNQLAVFPDAEGLTSSQMQQIAQEFNLSETVFVFPPGDPAHTQKLRIFTPGRELPFAGHPTIGTAFVLAAIGRITGEQDPVRIVFEEGVGPVPVVVKFQNKQSVFAQLSAAKMPEFRNDVPSVQSLAKVLTLDQDEILTGPETTRAVSCGVPFLCVPLRDRKAMARIKINLDHYSSQIAGSWAPQVYVFTHDAENADFRVRMFAPNFGIQEDPATGGGAAAFAGYLAAREKAKDGSFKWSLEQGIEMGRPSYLAIEADKNNGAITACRVGGSAVMVSEGWLALS